MKKVDMYSRKSTYGRPT